MFNLIYLRISLIRHFFEYLNISLRLCQHPSSNTATSLIEKKLDEMLASSLVLIRQSFTSIEVSEVTHTFKFMQSARLISFCIHSLVFLIRLSLSSVSIMSLTSFENDQSFESLQAFILAINQHVDSKEYAIMTLRFKKSKLEIIRKAWLICDRDRKTKESRKQTRRHDSSRQVKCSFSLIVKREEKDNDVWFLKMINLRHNHSANLVDAHSVLRRFVMIAKTKSEIFRQVTVQIALSQILFNLKIFDSIASVMNSENFENSIINSLFKTRDIYNLKTQFRREHFDSLTSIQTLIRDLNEEDWTFDFKKNDENHITHLFFMKKSSQTLLKSNHEIILMNCIYKTNRFKMSFFIIFDQTALHINYYVAFVFLIKKTNFDYA